jgi:hypothetical protein
MKTLKLNVIHRVVLISVLNGEAKAGGTLTDFKNMIRILEKIEFSDAEREEKGLKSDPEKQQIAWNVEKDVETEFELSDDQGELLKNIIQRKSDAKELSFEAAGPLIAVAEQLGIVV